MVDADKVATVEGGLDGAGLRVRIVASKFNREIVDALLQGALDALFEHGVKENCVEVVRVPGAFEIPLALAQIGDAPARWDAQIALGCVIRGETAHFHQVVEQCSRGVMDVMIKTGVPIAFGVLAVENAGLARARARGKINRGREAALAALEMAGLMKRLGG